ncbi:MAG: helix-turn-helix domain-containing protein [Candidatus Hodarchaeota archaeon]
MPNLIQKALNAKRESKHIEFKESFDTNSSQDWCGIIKGIVAIANSGGGIILFGVDNAGQPCGADLKPIFQLDPADIADKISKYTGSVDLEFEIREVKKGKQNLVAFVIQPVSIPIVFRKPGTYDIGSGKQRTAFSVGTVYFRHGAKSEPGTSDDIRKIIERQVDIIRKSWIKGVRKVVKAPHGAQVVTVLPSSRLAASTLSATTVRAVKDPKATPVLLTRDRKKASGVFVYEELSEGIFDEINNVIDANSVLAKGQQEFFLGQPIYYRIYAERHHVQQIEDTISLLFHCAVSKFYAPGLYWVLRLSDKLVAQTFADLYIQPRAPHIHYLIRMAILLGQDFCDWLFDRWHQKWKRHPQPPQFYWTFIDMKSHLERIDPRVIVARTTPTAQVALPGETSVPVSDLLKQPEKAAACLSSACIRIFQGDSGFRSTARNLDYFAYGLDIEKRSIQIANAIIKEIGEQQTGDFAEAVVDD